jgi:hypothetical protein
MLARQLDVEGFDNMTVKDVVTLIDANSDLLTLDDLKDMAEPVNEVEVENSAHSENEDEGLSKFEFNTNTM